MSGHYYDETFSLMVKPTTIWLVIAFAMSQKWILREFDVKNAFLYGDFKETINMDQPLALLTPISLIMFVCCKNLFMASLSSWLNS